MKNLVTICLIWIELISIVSITIGSSPSVVLYKVIFPPIEPTVPLIMTMDIKVYLAEKGVKARFLLRNVKFLEDFDVK